MNMFANLGNRPHKNVSFSACHTYKFAIFLLKNMLERQNQQCHFMSFSFAKKLCGSSLSQHTLPIFLVKNARFPVSPAHSNRLLQVPFSQVLLLQMALPHPGSQAPVSSQRWRHQCVGRKSQTARLMRLHKVLEPKSCVHHPLLGRA